MRHVFLDSIKSLMKLPHQILLVGDPQSHLLADSDLKVEKG